jgi:hypothetical protein
MLSSLLLALMLAAVPPGFNLNTATYTELHGLTGLTPDQATVLYEYIQGIGGLENIYEVLDLPGFTPETLQWLKENTIVLPPEAPGISPQVQDVMERLAQEDGPGDAAVEHWEDLLLRPVPINHASWWDLRGLDRVSFIDAAAVDSRLRSLGPVSAVTSLRGTDNLSYYGYRNMRDFISVREPDYSSNDFFGSYRLIYEDDEGRNGIGDGLEGQLSEMKAAISDILAGGRELSSTSIDSLALITRLSSEYSELLEARDASGFTHRVRVGTGDRYRAGARLSRGVNSIAGSEIITGLDAPVNSRFDVGKAYFSFQNDGFVRQVIAGNYRLSLAQGLLIDNTDELMYRNTYRAWGLTPDLTSTRQNALLGCAAQFEAGPMLGYAFGSKAPRDAITNLDGTPNVLYQGEFRPSEYSGVLNETTFGGYAFYDMGDFLPVGTAIGIGALGIQYSDSLNPSVAGFDIPNDAYAWDCPEYADMPSGDKLSYFAGSAQTVFRNMSAEVEAVRQNNGAWATISTASWQNNWLYVTGSYRNYALEFMNPYNRGFAEQHRFDDTVFDKPYRLNDPLASQLTDLPVPKPEEGIYLESRFQISERITFTKVYLDVWRNLAYSTENLRFQGEVEYRPVWPVRFRLKYKFQDKQNNKDIVPTNSRTQEYTFRTYVLPSGGDYFGIELRYGNVELTPNPLYSDDRNMDGGFLALQWEHRFSTDFSVLGGSTLWSTNGMSQWEFDDTGIDFLDGDGTKFYITTRNTLSDNLQLRFKFVRKDTFFPHNGFYRPDPVDQYHYQGDPDETVTDFGDHITDYGIRCQLDIRW